MTDTVENLILDLIDWGENGDPFFYENHHLSPQLIEDSRTGSGEEHQVDGHRASVGAPGAGSLP